MTYSSEIGDSLQDLWEAQKSYNRNIRARAYKPGTYESSPIFWTKQYLLGLVSEIDEVLREVNWKAHRAHKAGIIERNLALEFADLTKYVLSLWELWGFELKDVLGTTLEKSFWVEDQSEMELTPDPLHRNVLVTDLDGTLADWRKSFIKWMKDKQHVELKDDPDKSLLLDNDLELFYPDYYKWKELFETSGGYAELEPYWDSIQTVRALQEEGAYIIVFTARPYPQYKQIWWDTLQWLKRYSIKPDKLLIGAEPRILLAHKLKEQNNVILFEDDPGIILRAAHAGIDVYARSHPYNNGITHPNIKWVQAYTEIPIEGYFRKENTDGHD